MTTDLDDFTGTAKADTFSAILSDGEDETTWAIADSIDGAGGTTGKMDVSVIDSDTADGNSYAGRSTCDVSRPMSQFV